MEKRLALVAAFAAGVVGLPLTVQAQQPSHMAQIGFLNAVVRADYDTQAKDPYLDAFREGLAALGYVDGKNIHIEIRTPRKPEDLQPMAADLVAHKVDVIATAGPPSIDAAKHATDSIPIVIIACDRADRLVATIARPGGNITGMACISSDLSAKRLQLLQEALPGLSRVSVLYNAGVAAKVAELQDVQAAAKTLEIEVQPVALHDPTEFATAFGAISAEKAQALLVLTDPLTFQHIPEIAGFATQRHLPAMYGFRQFCDAGGLLSYGNNLITQFRRYGYFIDKILKGTKAGDIPIEEPTGFELIVNARTAKSFGLTIPQSILIRADEVIE